MRIEPRYMARILLVLTVLLHFSGYRMILFLYDDRMIL